MVCCFLKMRHTPWHIKSFRKFCLMNMLNGRFAIPLPWRNWTISPRTVFPAFRFIMPRQKAEKSIGMNIADNAVMVSADNGFAFPAICRGLEKAEALLKHNAIVLLTISHSHHCGVLGQYVEQMARKGFVGFAFSNTPKAMAPFGGNAALFGTNPLAFPMTGR